MPFVTSQETAWLKKIEQRLRQVAHFLAGAPAATSATQFSIGDGNPGTPTPGATTYPNPALDGVNFKVFRNGDGYLTEGVDYDLLPGGGIQLLGGNTFSAAETYLIWIL